ncbi:Uncharacterised protein [Mycobacteroides abscessus subsp. abscessus]|nr:Uncharacterised protein [Mycobacteroides abscessus subsp. abscessus]
MMRFHVNCVLGVTHASNCATLAGAGRTAERVSGTAGAGAPAVIVSTREEYGLAHGRSREDNGE